MSTYEKNYFIKWLNINPVKESIEALYGVNITLDTGESTALPDYLLIMQGDDYRRIFDVVITVNAVETTLGEFITFLTAQVANNNNISFPIPAEVTKKFENIANEVLNVPENNG